MVYQLDGSKVFAKDCLAKKDPTECCFHAELIKSIITPTFIVNSVYDSWLVRLKLFSHQTDPIPETPKQIDGNETMLV